MLYQVLYTTCKDIFSWEETQYLPLPNFTSPLDPTIYPYFLLRFEELFFTSSPETVTLYLPSSLFLRTFSQVSKSAFIQSLIVFKAGVSFINSSLCLSYQEKRRARPGNSQSRNLKTTSSTIKIITVVNR